MIYRCMRADISISNTETAIYLIPNAPVICLHYTCRWGFYGAIVGEIQLIYTDGDPYHWDIILSLSPSCLPCLGTFTGIYKRGT